MLTDPARLLTVLRAAQYLSNLPLQENPWVALAQTLQGVFRCDLVMIVRAGDGGEPDLVHSYPDDLPVAHLFDLARGEARAVLETGFLGELQLEAPPCSLAFLPLPRGRFTARVAIAGRLGGVPFSREDLEILLALGGLFGNVVARMDTEHELRDNQARLETANARLLHEIAERMRAEEERARVQTQFQQAQKLESLGSLAGGVAHDMNNVLGAILALASAHVGLQAPGSPSRRAFEIIRDAAFRGGDMVKRLLNFARRNPIESRALDLNALLQEETRLLERTTLAKVNVEMDLDPALHPILGDPSALSHVFMNLCVNAVDAMAEGGRLTLSTRNEGEASVRVTVADTGCGMAREVLDRALDPFFTTKEVGKGTGLGLSLVYSTVRAHQGELELKSEPGVGTQVSLVFPATVPVQAPEAAGRTRGAGPVRALNVLLVDDDELVQQSIAMLIELLGHTVTPALTGEEAIATLQGGCDPDVVVLDMNMPGLGGRGTLPVLRTLRPALPILLATGRADQDVLDFLAGFDGVALLPKPYSFEDLQDRFEALTQDGDTVRP